MKRLALLLLAVAVLLPAAASAQLTMQMSNGWSFSFAGNVNAFWVFTSQTNSGPKNSSVRTGLLPTFATFEAKGREAGMNLTVHFGFAPQIQNAAIHDQFDVQSGAAIDMRQVYLTVGGQWGQLLAGRELGLFSRQNILNDMTLFGVGAVGIRTTPGTGPQGGGTTLGRIGYGYLYPNFDAQLTYSTRAGRPAQLSIGAFQPSIVGSGGHTFPTIPRLEAEFTYNQKSGKNKYKFWAGGLWPTTKNAVTGGNSASSVGGTAGVRGDFADLSVVVSAYIGKGVGNTLLFSGNEVAPNGTDLRKSDGGYAQVMYTVNKKTGLGVSYGFSRFKNASAGETVGSGGEKNGGPPGGHAPPGGYPQQAKALKPAVAGTRRRAGT